MMLPNSTQVPNCFFDEYLAKLGHKELKILLVITRQTLGWIEDSTTKRRKEKDWIATSQMELKTGLSKKAISLAISSLVAQDLIEVFDKTGKPCSLPSDRKGKLRLYYRLNLMSKGNTDDEKDMQNIPKPPITSVYFTEQGQLNRHTTKETITKENGEKDFTWEDFLNSLHDSPQRHINIIGYFFEKKKLAFDTREKAETALRRHLRPAKLLVPFSDAEIVKSASHLSRTFPSFTLETVYKKLTS